MGYYVDRTVYVDFINGLIQQARDYCMRSPNLPAPSLAKGLILPIPHGTQMLEPVLRDEEVVAYKWRRPELVQGQCLASWSLPDAALTESDAMMDGCTCPGPHLASHRSTHACIASSHAWLSPLCIRLAWLRHEDFLSAVREEAAVKIQNMHRAKVARGILRERREQVLATIGMEAPSLSPTEPPLPNPPWDGCCRRTSSVALGPSMGGARCGRCRRPWCRGTNRIALSRRGSLSRPRRQPRRI